MPLFGKSFGRRSRDEVNTADNASETKKVKNKKEKKEKEKKEKVKRNNSSNSRVVSNEDIHEKDKQPTLPAEPLNVQVEDKQAKEEKVVAKDKDDGNQVKVAKKSKVEDLLKEKQSEVDLLKQEVDDLKQQMEKMRAGYEEKRNEDQRKHEEATKEAQAKWEALDKSRREEIEKEKQRFAEEEAKLKNALQQMEEERERLQEAERRRLEEDDRRRQEEAVRKQKKKAQKEKVKKEEDNRRFILREKRLRTLCGYLSKEGHIRKNWKTRFFAIRGQELYYYTDNTQQNVKGKMPLTGVQVTTSMARKHAFTIVLQDGTNYNLCAANDYERENWYCQLCVCAIDGIRRMDAVNLIAGRYVDLSRSSLASNIEDAQVKHSKESML